MCRDAPLLPILHRRVLEHVGHFALAGGLAVVFGVSPASAAFLAYDQDVR